MKPGVARRAGSSLEPEVTYRKVSTLELSTRAGRLQPSPTLAITAKARQLRAEGRKIISMAAGEPDFNTPRSICEAAERAMNEGVTKYTPSSGLPELKEAVAQKFQRENGLRYDPTQIVVSCGAKHSVYNALQVLIDEGDEVILIAPYWATYRDQVVLAGGTPVVHHTRYENGFQPDLDELKALITPRTKAILINTPSNPTGAAYSRQTLKQLAALALTRGLWVIADEIYERLTYDGFEHLSIASLGNEIYDRTVTISGCSKTYAMTGWRIGFAAAPAPVAKAMGMLQDQVTSNPTAFAQIGAIAALNLPATELSQMVATFAERRSLILDALRQLPNVETPSPEGAFYAFPNVSHYFEGDDTKLTELILEKAEVAVVPGSVFEGPGHIRLSYAAKPDDIKTAVERIGNLLAELDA